MRYLSMAFIVIVALALPCNAQEDKTRALEAKLASPVAEYLISERDPLNALLYVAADFQLPIGIEWIRDTGKPVSSSWIETTVLAILSDIAALNGQYLISANNGVVHIGPVAWMGTERDVLDLRLDSFEVSNETVNEALFKLRHQVQPLMEPDYVRQGGYGYSITSGFGDRPVTLKLTNPTARDVLDALCLAADLKVWLVGYTSSPTKTSAGFLRTASLWEEKVSEVPDIEQPYISMHVWGTPVGANRAPMLDPWNKLPIKIGPNSQKPGQAP